MVGYVLLVIRAGRWPIALLAALALAVAGCGGAGSDTTAPADTSASGGPPCTKEALMKATEAYAEDPIQGIDVFECSGAWAYAGVTTPGPDGFEYTQVFQWEDGAWKAVDRAAPCQDGKIPSEILQAACESN
jgi:hypothetical protein